MTILKRVFAFLLVSCFLFAAVFSVSGCGGLASAVTTAASTSLGGMEVWVFVPAAGARNIIVKNSPKVTPPSGYVALSGATLAIVGGNSAVTDSTGCAYMGGLANNSYNVAVGKDGYAIYTETVTVSTGQTTNVGGSSGVQIETSTTPGILNLSALSGIGGDSITITGANFGPTQGASTITFNGTAVTSVTSWSSTSIVCRVPIGATTGNVVVTVGGTASNGVSFTVSSKIIIGGNFTSYNGTDRSKIARVNSDGTLDTSFAPGTGANSFVNSIVVQSDGKILIGGYFTKYNDIDRSMIARINSDGSLDTSFDPGTGVSIDSDVESVVIQSDGKILIGGDFTSYNDTARSMIARINSDGSLDTSFNPAPAAGANSYIKSVAVQSDGKILIGGDFTNYNGTNINRLARINSDGSLDASFNPAPAAGANNDVHSMVVQSDGKILIIGEFTNYNGIARGKIARINSDGSLDASFNPVPAAGATGGDIESVAVQSDGKILIGGAFTQYNGTTTNYIARLSSDGTLDTSFNPAPAAGANNTVVSVAVQSDGKILIGGAFTTYNGTTTNYIARLSSDGTLDTTFSPSTGPNSFIISVALQ